MMRASVIFAFGVAATIAAGAAHADKAAVIVIPSRPGIPIVINGVDASYAIVEGDWGLARPGHMPVTVIGGRPVIPNPVYTRRYSYHPRYGAPPPRGRNEIEPPPDRLLPPPAETYSRSWSTHAPAVPVADTQPHPALPFNVGGDAVPPTIVDPQTYQPPPMVVVPRGRRP